MCTPLAVGHFFCTRQYSKGLGLLGASRQPALKGRLCWCSISIDEGSGVLSALGALQKSRKRPTQVCAFNYGTELFHVLAFLIPVEKYPIETDLKEKAYELMAAEELTVMEAKVWRNSFMTAALMEAFTRWSIEKYKKRKGQCRCGMHPKPIPSPASVSEVYAPKSL